MGGQRRLGLIGQTSKGCCCANSAESEERREVFSDDASASFAAAKRQVPSGERPTSHLTRNNPHKMQDGWHAIEFPADIDRTHTKQAARSNQLNGPGSNAHPQPTPLPLADDFVAAHGPPSTLIGYIRLALLSTITSSSNGVGARTALLPRVATAAASAAAPGVVHRRDGTFGFGIGLGIIMMLCWGDGRILTYPTPKPKHHQTATNTGRPSCLLQHQQPPHGNGFHTSAAAWMGRKGGASAFEKRLPPSAFRVPFFL